MSGRISRHGCSHPQHCTWLAWTPVWRVLLSECDTNRNTAVQNSPAHVCATSVAMQIPHCWQNIKFSTPFLFTFFIRSWKETILPQSTVCGLKYFATWNSGKWLKFSAFHLRSPVYFHGRNRTRYEVCTSKHGSRLTMSPYNTTRHQPGSLQGGRKSTKLQLPQIASLTNNSATVSEQTVVWEYRKFIR
jgi:hypothetical protein